MSANADALRFPGNGGNRFKGFGIAAGLVVAVLVAVTLFVLATRHAATTLDPVAPRTSSWMFSDFLCCDERPRTLVDSPHATS